eukprot:gnl/Spiro4/18297_TR9784_c0_g1_i1.p1 gnl/Spiro4/18297_TR9784_c0_g1~~gnl/Spiro4/18297_TR9784_c0_g1_i1.p1  ORF type:complete len:597 (+),score=65.64 gnl/Spiro4/18297_TR9784_c0_g1_i1:250-1791(+)
MSLTTEETIKTAIADIPQPKTSPLFSSVSDAKWRLALLKLLRAASGWSYLESLRDLVQQLKDKNYLHVLDDPYGASLLEVLSYFAGKKLLEPVTDYAVGGFPARHTQKNRLLAHQIETLCTGPDSSCALVVDTMILRRIEELPDFAATVASAIRSRSITLVIPQGWINGINIFTQHTITKTLTSLVHDWLAALEAADSRFKGTLEDFEMDEILRRPIEERLVAALLSVGVKELSVADVLGAIYWMHPNWISKETIIKKFSGDRITAKSIEMLMKPVLFPTEYTWLDFFLRFAKCEKESHGTYKEIIKAYVEAFHIHSFNSLTTAAKVIHNQVQDLDTEMYYDVPLPYKSYGLVTLLYLLANFDQKTVPAHLVGTADFIPRTAKQIMILDDVAGSGDSLSVAHTFVVQSRPELWEEGLINIILAPLLTTEGTDLPANKHTEIIVGSLAPEILPKYNPWQGGPGYGVKNLVIVFPYMAPDNNNGFAVKFAEMFTPVPGIKDYPDYHIKAESWCFQ